MKERNIHELLIILKDNIDLLETGLCALTITLHSISLITRKEAELLLDYIENNPPKGQNKYKAKYAGLYWRIGEKKWRIIWLDKHIKLTAMSIY